MPYKTLNSRPWVSAVSMAADITSEEIGLSNAIGYCVQAQWTGTPTGVLKLQANMNGLDWVDIPDTSINLSGATGSQIWNVDAAYYESVRLFYDFTSGTGTLTSTISIKG